MLTNSIMLPLPALPKEKGINEKGKVSFLITCLFLTFFIYFVDLRFTFNIASIQFSLLYDILFLLFSKVLFAGELGSGKYIGLNFYALLMYYMIGNVRLIFIFHPTH
jgi:hypothetical protein